MQLESKEISICSFEMELIFILSTKVGIVKKLFKNGSKSDSINNSIWPKASILLGAIAIKVTKGPKHSRETS